MLIDNRFATDGEYPLTEEKKGRGWLVQRAYDRTLRRDVVLKSVPARDQREVRELAQEEEMLRRTRSKYVVSSFGLLRTPNPAATARLRTHLVVELFSEDTVQTSSNATAGGWTRTDLYASRSTCWKPSRR